MKSLNDNKIDQLEKVSHETAARPFSIHQTYVGGENTNALYLHYHPEAEFFYLEEGTLSFYIDNEAYELHKGDAVFIPPHLVHNADKEPGIPCIYDALVFSPEWLSRYTGPEGNLYINTLLENKKESIMLFQHDEPQNKEILKKIANFKNYSSQPINTYELRLLGELLINIQDIYNNVSRKIVKNEKRDSSRDGIQKGIDYLLMHFNERIALTDLAEQSGYSKSHFCHSFKSHTGYAPFAFLNRIRVIKATERLIISDDKITQIASDCGFDNISYFNRVFRAQIGMSPGEYRTTGRQHRRPWNE